MANVPLLLSLLLLSSADGGRLTTPEASNLTASAKVPTQPYLRLPVFVDSRLPLVEKEHFIPARGTGQETLPEPVRRVLLPVRPNTSPPSASGVSVKTQCTRNEMLVQVPRSILSNREQDSRVKLGTCQASNSTEDYLYFKHDLNQCGTQRKIINDKVYYRNTLQYAPPALQGPIRRTAPFSLPVECHFNRYQYSYKIGYMPKMRMRKIFKPMRNTAKFILTSRNAQWERLSPSHHYVLGRPMYFEAEALSVSQDERLYLHLCYATPEESHTSTPQYPVVRDFGCMVESKERHSRFIPYKPTAVRFTVDAFLFAGMTGQQLYMHCSMSVGSSSPTTTAKSCNYNRKAQRWVELDGSYSVCACCDSKCNSAASAATKIISSRPWTVDSNVKPTSAPKRKMRTSPTAAAAEAQTQTSRGMPERATALRPGDTAVESVVKELDWPFGGGGVALVELEGEEQPVKGSAFVEVEEDTEPRIVFEEIFDFGQ